MRQLLALTEEKTMLVSKSNEINTSTFINSGNCNERKSSKSMELLDFLSLQTDVLLLSNIYMEKDNA